MIIIVYKVGILIHVNTETFISRLSYIGLRLSCVGVAFVLQWGYQLYYTLHRGCLLGT